MPGFFLIAGFFAALLLERRPARAWLRSRLTRLGIPLVTGMALIVPLQNAILRHGPREAIHLPDNAVLSHLWFLPVLMMLCVALAASWRLVVRIRWPDLPVWALGIAFGVWMIALRGGEMVANLNLALADGMIDLEATIAYAPYFALGVAARRNPAIFARLVRPDRWTIAVGLVALAVYCQYWHPANRIEFLTAQFAGALAAPCILQSLFSLLARHFDRPSPLVDRLVDASFSIYLLHHPIVIGLSVALLYVKWPPMLEWALVCVATLALSYAMHRALSRNRLFLMLFNGVMPDARRGLLTRPSAPSPS